MGKPRSQRGSVQPDDQLDFDLVSARPGTFALVPTETCLIGCGVTKSP
jgi:hypothetical protein